MLAHALALVHGAQMAPEPPVVLEVLVVPVEVVALVPVVVPVVPVVAWGQLQVWVVLLQVTAPQSAAPVQGLAESQKPPAGLLVLQ